MNQSELPFEGDTHTPTKPQSELTDAVARIPRFWQREILLARALADEDIPDWLLTPIDYSFCPASYWATQDLCQLVANIKGAERKKEALRLIQQGRLAGASGLVLTDSVSDAERTLLGRIHPALMGGEYLPDYFADEVEIARVTMDSTTQDVISIRAYPKGGWIGYRVADEYESTVEIKPKFSKRPLTLGQLVRLIDTGDREELGPIGLGIIQINFDCHEEPAEDYADFMHFTSEFYPDLTKHYWFATQRWLKQNRKAGAAL